MSSALSGNVLTDAEKQTVARWRPSEANPYLRVREMS